MDFFKKMFVIFFLIVYPSLGSLDIPSVNITYHLNLEEETGSILSLSRCDDKINIQNQENWFHLLRLENNKWNTVFICGYQDHNNKIPPLFTTFKIEDFRSRSNLDFRPYPLLEMIYFFGHWYGECEKYASYQECLEQKVLHAKTLGAFINVLTSCLRQNQQNAEILEVFTKASNFLEEIKAKSTNGEAQIHFDRIVENLRSVFHN